MRRLSKASAFVLKCYAVFFLTPVILCCAGWLFHRIEDDDYRPQFSLLEIGMKKEKAASVLAGIRLEAQRRPDGTEFVFFREPDLFASESYYLIFRDGILIEKDYGS